MDFFKAQLERIQRQLSGLTPSQKMLTLSLVTIMVMTLVWWGRYAGEPEMVPLFSKSVSAEDLDRLPGILTSHNIHNIVVGDKINVPADQKMQAYSVLAYAKALPRGNSGFDDILKSTNPLQPESTTEKQWNHAREVWLGQLISNFPGVNDAKVTLDPQRELRIAGNVEPVAGVIIQMEPGTKAGQDLVDAAGDLIQGAMAGLQKSAIKIVINGKPYHLTDSDNGDVASADSVARVHAAEMELKQKIKEQFSYIVGLIPTVTVRINYSKTEQNSLTYDPKGSVSKEVDVRSHTTDTPILGAGPQEAGAVPNIGLSTGPNPSSGAPLSSTSEETETKSQNFVGSTQLRTMTPAGETTPVAATVRVPQDYFPLAWRKLHPKAGEPTEVALNAYIKDELASIRAGVMKCVNLKSQDDVSVEYYVDLSPIVAAAPVATSAFSTVLLNPHRIQEVVLGALALVSLFMVSTLVKKGAPAPMPALAGIGDGGPSAPDILDAGEALIGQVSATDPSMLGIEMDEESIRAQQVMQQVSNLVKESPESAAALVKRWLVRA